MALTCGPEVKVAHPTSHPKSHYLRNVTTQSSSPAEQVHPETGSSSDSDSSDEEQRGNHQGPHRKTAKVFTGSGFWTAGYPPPSLPWWPGCSVLQGNQMQSFWWQGLTNPPNEPLSVVADFAPKKNESTKHKMQWKPPPPRSRGPFSFSWAIWSTGCWN